MPYKKSYAKKSRRTYRPRRMASKAATKAMYRIAKKVTLKQSEPKVASQLYSSLGGPNPGHQVIRHNLPAFWEGFLETRCTTSNNANPGTNVFDTRVGDEIVATGLKIRIQFLNAPTQSNVSWKYWIFQYQSNDAPTNGSQFFVGPSGSGGNQNRMIDFVDTRKYKILKAGHIFTASRTSNMNQSCVYTNSTHPYILGTALDGSQPKMHSTYRDIWIPLKNKKIRYEANDSPIPKFKDIGMCIVAYDVNNTSQDTTLGYVDFVHRLYFRDP